MLNSAYPHKSGSTNNYKLATRPMYPAKIYAVCLEGKRMLKTKLLLITIFAISVSSSTRATPKRAAPRPSTPVLLAQMCVAEISWRHNTAECRLMWEINGRQANRANISIGGQTRQFNTYFKQPNTTRRWIQYLNKKATKPKHWPRKAGLWKTHQPIWLTYLAAATKFYNEFKQKTLNPLCPRATDYGGKCGDGKGACDVPRQKCAKPIWCLEGLTHQSYWSLDCCHDKTQCTGLPFRKLNRQEKRKLRRYRRKKE